ncbi:MAG TPA: aldo/keto reductase [Bacteroidales bacterium]|nr:aldo/keto reductase [Bacteroidales bacterium]
MLSNPVNLPKVIFGTSALGNLYVEQPESVKTKIISECIEKSKLPVVFDSAGKYGAGLALETLGKILTKLDIPAEDVLISNKLGWLRTPLLTDEPTFEPGVWKNLKYDAVQRISYDGIIECFEQGNSLLGQKYTPQLVSVHDPDEYLAVADSDASYKNRFNDIIEAYRALSDLKKQGKATAIGVGAKDWKVIRELYNHIQLDWVMFANSMTIMNHPIELIEFMEKLRKDGVTIINSAVFQAGFLIGGEYYDYRKIKPDTPENIRIFRWREDFHQLCRKYNISPMIACVNFALRAPGVHSISLNTSKPEHVEKNVASANAIVPDDFYQDMKKAGLINDYCTFV